MQQRISVIIPVFNRGKLLKEALLSVKNQTLQPCEIILIDDFSTDDTMALMQTYVHQFQLNIKIVQNQRSKGVSGATNTGILHAEGDYIALLDSDDLWAPRHLSNLAHNIMQYQDVLAAFSDFKFFGTAFDASTQTSLFRFNISEVLQKSFTEVRRNVFLSDNNPLHMLCDHGFVFRCPGSLLSMRLFKERGILFNERLAYTQDAHFAFLAANYTRFLFVRETTLLIRRHEGNDGDSRYKKIISKNLVVRAKDLEKYYIYKTKDNNTKNKIEKFILHLYREGLYSAHANNSFLEMCGLYLQVPFKIILLLYVDKIKRIFS